MVYSLPLAEFLIIRLTIEFALCNLIYKENHRLQELLLSKSYKEMSMQFQVFSDFLNNFQSKGT